MDKKYIESLENFSVALEQLVSEMKRMSDSKKEETAPGGSLSENKETLISISENIETIKSDVSDIKKQNDEILKNQNTILKIGKSKSPLDKVSDDKDSSAIGKGITTILLMAGAIVALGAAFNIVGDVDFTSVIALSAAMPLLAIAFSKVAENVSDMSYKDVLKVNLILISIAASLFVTGLILSHMPVVGIFQILSALGVALTLGLIVSGITIFGFTFGGLSSLFNQLGDLSIEDTFTIGGILVAIAGSIAAAAWVLEGMPEFTLDQMINILGFSTSFAIASSLMAVPIWVISKMGLNVKDAMIGGLVILTIAAVIAGSSWLVSFGNYGDYPDSDWAAGVGLSMLAFGIPMLALGVIMVATGGVGFVALALGAASVLILSATIMGASHILALGNYGQHPDASWAAGVGLSMFMFGTPILMLGSFIVATFGFGAKVLDAGTNATLKLASTIVLASHILAKGNYNIGYPTEEWSKGVGLAIGAFSPVYKMIMANGVLSLFGGGVDPEDFNNSIESLAGSIVVAAEKFSESKGEFKNAPSEEWSKGVSLAIGAFSPIYETLAGQSWWNANVDPEDFNTAIISVVKGIEFAAVEFAKINVAFKKAPPKEWGEGVSAAFEGFVPLYDGMSGWFSLDMDDINDVNPMIYQIARSMVNTSLFLQGWYIKDGNWLKGQKPIYDNAPDKKWIKGVGEGILTFADIYSALDSNASAQILSLGLAGHGVSYEMIEDGNRKIRTIIHGMIASSAILARMKKLEPLINTEFIKEVGENISQWSTIIQDIKDISDDDLIESVSRLDKLATGFENLSNSLNNLSSSIHGFKPEFVSVLSEVSGVNLTVDSPDIDIKESERSWWDRIFNPVPEEERETKAKVEAMIEPGEKGEEDLSIRDLYEKLDELKAELQIISSNSSTLSSYVNELRMGGDIKMDI